MKIENFKIEDWMNEYESSAKYDLSGTCINPLSVNELLNLCEIKDITQVLNRPLDYGDIKGSDKLKNAIKTLYEKQENENIIVTHGAIGANQLVFLSLLQANDEVISVLPVYQQHYSIPEACGADVKKVFLKEENDWVLDIEDLKKVVSSKTKLICLNNPNNPTGALISDEKMLEIVELASQNDAWILCDEVYRGLNFSDKKYSQSVADIYDKGISVGSMSKTYSLPGLRVGWICANSDFIEEVVHHREYNTISVSILDEYFAAIALENKEKISERNFRILNESKCIFEDWLSKNKNLSCVLPHAGTTVFLKYNKDISSEDFCRKLQEETGVALLPGKALELEGYVRLGFCKSPNYLKNALERISDFIEKL